MNKDINYSTTRVVYASAESTWKVLLSGQLYKKAWGAELNTTWQPGTGLQLSGLWEGLEYTDKGVVEIKEDYILLKYSYWSSFWGTDDVPEQYCCISYSMHQLDACSCELTISQYGFRDEKHYSDTISLWESTINLAKCESEKDTLTVMNDLIFNDLISLIDKIPVTSYNKSIGNGWNAAQIAAHIIMGNTGLKKFLTHSPFDSSDPYDLNVQAIRSMMLNTENKMHSPEFLIPHVEGYNKITHRQLLVNIHGEIKDCIQTLGFSNKAGGFEIPPFGYMSIFEWLNFSLFHIGRHYKQMEAVHQQRKE